MKFLMWTRDERTMARNSTLFPTFLHQSSTIPNANVLGEWLHLIYLDLSGCYAVPCCQM